ncbi:GNAT family N-acetyltransferase [Nonomuraea jiangxiensis]|uniref:FR47-like protein n=1 Tax=Nonomuraea jiangxiensis TaxID=633440 RepID=A0A1G8M0K4_9ACTN|nr:GNAT family N-acetyltransferase [Nonomuraea jiangxiensis]SDI61415.1 FR47-like protein [Nonomuraea jiangxiensis]
MTRDNLDSGRPHPLDNSVHSALTGPHAHFALRRGNVLRYPSDVSPFMALPDSPDDADWADVAALAGPGGVAGLTGRTVEPPDGWEVVTRAALLQLVDDGVAAAPDEEAVRLTSADVPEMLALAERTKPGPFLPRTIEMGAYLGIRHSGRLVAMAGERLRLPGWTEISGVCTDAGWRGRGLGTRLVLAVAAGIRERGERPFLHVLASNTNAVRLYESLGFRLHRTTTLVLTRPPAEPPSR